MNSKLPASKIVSQQSKFPLKIFVIICTSIAMSFLFFSNYSRIFDYKIDMGGDNIYYYSLGKALSEGKGFTNTIGFEESPHTHFPPGYPLFISLMMKMGFNDIASVKMVNGFLSYICMFLLCYFLYLISKKWLIAIAAAAFFASQPVILRYSTIIMSESLFILISLIIMIIMVKWDVTQAFKDKKRYWKDGLVLFLLIACMSYVYFVRTMALAIIFAVILYYAIILLVELFKFVRLKKQNIEEQDVRTEKKRGLLKQGLLLFLLILSFLIPKFSWDARDSKINKKSDNYVDAFFLKPGGEKMETFDDWKTRVINNATSYTTKWIPTAVFGTFPDTGKEATAGDWIKGFLIIALFVVALIALPKGGLLLFLYLGITMTVMLVWPEMYTSHRYITPIIPFLIFLYIYGIYAIMNWIVSRFIKPKKENYWQMAITTIACFIFIIPAYPIYAETMKVEEKKASHKEYVPENSGYPLAHYVEAMKWVKTNIQDTGKVMTRKPELLFMYTNGRKSDSFPWYATPDEIIDLLTENQYKYVIIDTWFRHAYVTLVPAIQQYPDKFKVLHQIGEANEALQLNPTYVVEFNPNWGYTGDTLNGKKHGKGVWAMQDGRILTGSFVNDIPEGYGVMTDETGKVLAKGIWANGQLIRPEPIE